MEKYKLFSRAAIDYHRLINLVLVPSNLWLHFFYFLRNGYAACGLDPMFSGGFNLIPTFIKCLMGEYKIVRWLRDMPVGTPLMFIPMGFVLPLVSERVSRHNILKIAVNSVSKRILKNNLTNRKHCDIMFKH